MHATFSIDGNTVLDADLTHGQPTPPQQMAELIATAQTSKQPWLKLAMVPLAEAILTGRDVAITVSTDVSGWTLDVDHTL